MSNVNNINKDQLDSSTQLHFLEQLPHSLLTEISTYLGGVKTGRRPMNTGSDVLLLAVALTASQSSWEKCQYSGDNEKLLSPASKAVLKAQEDWEERFEIVDFGRLQTDAGIGSKLNDVDLWWAKPKLNDVDLKAILICIDAKNNVKSLKLTECVNILGHGLEPLVGSTNLERIDLSLATSPKCAKYVKDIQLSEDTILPILRSFFGLSLRHIQLPWVWRQKKSPVLTLFLQDYNSHLEKLELICQHTLTQGAVSRECENESDVGMHLSDERYGIQTATCFDCLKHFCLGEGCCGEYVDTFEFCSSCEKYYCNGCDHIMDCSKCDKLSCSGCCDVHFCQDCSSAFCLDCKIVNYCSKCFNASCWDCKLPMFCSQCMKTECSDCSEMMYCSECYDCFCMDCGADKIRYSALRNEILCSTCFGG